MGNVAPTLVGLEKDVYCKHEEYQGEPREKWNVSRGGSKKAKPSALADLGKRHDKTLAAVKAGSPF